MPKTGYNPFQKIPGEMMPTLSLDDYLSLPYTLVVIPDDGVWFVQIRELEGCMTFTEKWEDILPMIEDAKRLWIELALERGRPVPVPETPVRVANMM
jgi:predicted RNase H-like HicB family nuclease